MRAPELKKKTPGRTQWASLQLQAGFEKAEFVEVAIVADSLGTGCTHFAADHRGLTAVCSLD